MRVIVFGASGRTGLEVIRQAALAGHEVTGFVHRSPLPPDSASTATVVRGDVRDESVVARAIHGHHAVLVALDHASGGGDRILSVGTANIVRAMQRSGPRRLVVVTGVDLVSDPDRLLTSPEAVAIPPRRGLSADQSRQEQLVRDSRLGWVHVRAMNLSDGPSSGGYRAGTDVELRASASVSRGDVAEFMVGQVGTSTWIRKSVLLVGLPAPE